MKLEPIPGFTGYFAGNDGHIYSNRYNKGTQRLSGNLKCLKQGIQSTGKYFTVNLIRNDGSKQTNRVHRLVCAAFHGPSPFQKATTSHLDGNWRNNKPENLKWESHSDNHKRKKEHGTDDIGIKNSRSLIDLTTLKKIRKLLSLGKLTHEEIGNKFGLNRVFITKINRGHRYKGQGE